MPDETVPTFVGFISRIHLGETVWKGETLSETFGKTADKTSVGHVRGRQTGR